MTIALSEDKRRLLIESLRRLPDANWPGERAVASARDADALVEFAYRAVVWRLQDAERLINAVRIVRLASAARVLGSAQRAFDSALEHAKVRRHSTSRGGQHGTK